MTESMATGTQQHRQTIINMGTRITVITFTGRSQDNYFLFFLFAMLILIDHVHHKGMDMVYQD